MELLTKSKKAKTVKSGFAPAPGPERPIYELISASEWWKSQCDEFWRTAATGKILLPRLKDAVAELKQSGFEIEAPWLESTAKNLKEFRSGLRSGFGEYEKLVFGAVQAKVNDLVAVSSAEMVSDKDVALVKPLVEVLHTLAQAENAEQSMKNCHTALVSWYETLRSDFLQKDIMSQITKAKDSKSWNWEIMDKAVGELQGVTVHDSFHDFMLTIADFLYTQLHLEVT